MNVETYKTSSGKDLILDYIDKLKNQLERADGFAVIEKLEQDKFDELKIKNWQGKISEVYFYKHNRMFYVIADSENIYVLHACRKQKNKTEKKDSEIVIKRAKEIGNIVSKKFI